MGFLVEEVAKLIPLFQGLHDQMDWAGKPYTKTGLMEEGYMRVLFVFVLFCHVIHLNCKLLFSCWPP